MSGASEQANGRASGPVLQSLFLAVIEHSAFLPRQDENGGKWIHRTPTAFQLIISNDPVCSETSAWEVLCEELNAPPISQRDLATRHDERSCLVPREKVKEFRCVGLKVWNSAKQGGNVSALSRIRVWSKPVNRLALSQTDVSG